MKGVHRNFRPATLLKKRLWHRCFPVNFVKFIRTPFSEKSSTSSEIRGVFQYWLTNEARKYM